MTVIEISPPELVRPVPEGPAIEMRPATALDADAIVALYEGLSAESRHARFMQATPRLHSSLRAALADIEAATVWLAFDAGACIGEARVVRSSRQHCADLAVTIADEYQGRGLGRRLAKRAVRELLRNGECVSMSMMATNYAAAKLARRAGVRLRLDDGALEGELAPSTASGCGAA